MKKTFVWALAATLMATAAFAQRDITANATFAVGAPTTTNNRDSCEITVSPAATLLLPHFEVNVAAPSTEAVNTIFTITNTSWLPQIAHVVVWTDWSYPVLDFNIWLTGYDVQGLSMYDILARGIIPPTGYALQGATGASPVGARSAVQPLAGPSPNPNHLGNVPALCANLPGPIPANILAEVRSALTTGFWNFCPGPGGTLVRRQVGSAHGANAIGYVTVDVAATCTLAFPTDPVYLTSEILFDNVLIGDYQRINPIATVGNYAGGSPMVHIKAIPEGGAAGVRQETNLPYTFYDRLTPVAAPGDPGTATVDRRQPLPALFAARYIQGGTGNFNTELVVWREGITGRAATADCLVAPNASLALTEIVRFDESENPTIQQQACIVSPCPPDIVGLLPETRRVPVTDTVIFPPRSNTADLGGWMYMNLNNNFTGAAYHPNRQAGGSHQGVSQNWVVVTMTAEGRYGVDFDAAYLGNGCTPNPGVTVQGRTAPRIGPAPRITPAGVQ
jgi:hypothetical protein